MFDKSCLIADIDKIGKANKVEFTLVTDSQDVNATLESVGVKDSYGCLFVAVNNGDYIAVYGVENSVPYLDRHAWLVYDETAGKYRQEVVGKPRYWRFQPLYKGGQYLLKMQRTRYRDNDGKAKVYYRFDKDGVTIFEGDDLHCSPMHEPTSNASMRALMDFLTLQHGDTDAEYFDSYTPAQDAFCRSADCEYLQLEAEDPKERNA